MAHLLMLSCYSYIVFHSVLTVVRQCFRSQVGGSDLEARRSLNTALGFLDQFTGSLALETGLG